MMMRALLCLAGQEQLFLLGGAIFVVIVATAYGQIRLNRWNQPFYDALAHRDFRQFHGPAGRLRRSSWPCFWF